MVCRKFLLISFLGVYTALVFPCLTFATEVKDGITVEPAFIEVILDSNEDQQTIPIKYTNHSDKKIELELFPYDYKQLNEKGELEFNVEDSYQYSLVSYLSFESNNTIEIDPEESKVFNVSIKNRQDISPGGHYAAVIARVKQDKGVSSGSSVTPAVSSLILLRKTGGEIFDIKLVNVDYPSSPVVFSIPDYITLNFNNTGNIHLIPYGTLEITDIFGRKIYESQINIDSNIILPGTKRYIKTNLRQVNRSWPISIYKFSIKGQDSLKKTNYFYYDSFLYINKWSILVLPITILLGSVFLQRFSKKYAKKS